MSAGLSQASRPEAAPISGVRLLPSLAAAAVFPFDRVLTGMVGAGQGIEAICLYLGLSLAALEDSLVRLGLRTPNDRKLRKPGPRGWPVLDAMRLIAWRVAGIHPESIGERLGRSPGAVRAKARRLGIPTPDRKTLRRVDPSTLADPSPGFGCSATPPESNKPSAASVPAVCSTTVRPVVRPDAASPDIVTLRAALPPVAPSALPAAHEPGAQRELQLLRVLRDFDQASPPAKRDVSSTLVWQPTSPAKDAATKTAAQPTRGAKTRAIVGSLCRLTRDREFVLELSLRYLGRQHYRHVANEYGVTPRALATFYDRIDLPRDFDRSKFGPTYDEERANANLARLEYELVVCDQTKRFWWRHKRQERFWRLSFEGARLRGCPRERDPLNPRTIYV